jgi:hypothetical protein
VHTTWSTVSTSGINLGLLTWPSPKAGDFAELILLYIFLVHISRCVRQVIVLLTSKVVRCVTKFFSSRSFAVIRQSYDCRITITYVYTTWSTVSTSDINLGLLTLPSPKVGDFAELILIYIFFIHISRCVRQVIVLLISKVVRCVSKFCSSRSFAVLHQSYDCRNTITYVYTTWSTVSTSDINLGLLTLPSSKAGDFAELIVLYIFFVFTALDVF